jgi:predicted HicB family RNase H-like nuclease
MLKAGRPSKNSKVKVIESVQDLTEETVRLNLNISKELHKKLKLKAIEHNITVTDIVRSLLTDYVK